MLSFLELTNFKSFSHMKLDLRGPHGEPKKLAFIYGENGAGKSNLMFSLLFLNKTFDTMQNLERAKRLAEAGDRLVSGIRDEELKQNILKQVLHRECFSLQDLVSEYRMLGSAGQMTLRFGFRIEGKDGVYTCSFDESGVVEEELRYQLKERMGTVFSVRDGTAVLSPTTFFDAPYRAELAVTAEKYWGRHTFMAILFQEFKLKNRSYLAKRQEESLGKVLNWLHTCSVLCKYSQGEMAKVALPLRFLHELENGTLKNREDRGLLACEHALNEFFTQLYSDIKAVHYVFEPKGKGFSYELYFSKLVGGHVLEVPASLESTGTRKLLELFPFLFSAVHGEAVFVDEMDSGMHDLLIGALLEQLRGGMKGQFVATTHNTMLMEQLPPECVYIIRADAWGEKEVVCVADYEHRTQKNNNMRSKYLHGAYEGVPYSGNLDLAELVEEALQNAEVPQTRKNEPSFAPKEGEGG